MTPADNIFSFSATVAAGTTAGAKSLPAGIADAQARTGSTSIALTVRSPDPPKLVISQVYGGGGNAGSTYRNDFIEIFNGGVAPVNVRGWSVQYASSTGTSWQVTPLSGSILPGRYYLVQQAQGAGGTVNLPAPDAIGTISMAAGSGKVALVSSTTALSARAPRRPPSSIGSATGPPTARRRARRPRSAPRRRPFATATARSTRTTTSPTSRSARRTRAAAPAGRRRRRGRRPRPRCPPANPRCSR